MSRRRKPKIDEQRVERVEQFFARHLRHVVGRWSGTPFVLEDWQRDDVVRPLFGTIDADGNRQYRTAYLEVPRKNGKSTLAAGIALYLLFADREPGAEVYGAAADKDQAKIVFNVARRMVEASPALRKRCRIVGDSIVTHAGNVYRALSAEAYTKHGLNAHGIVFDELHAQPTRELWDVLTTSTGAREQPLTVALTTAGYDRDSVCFEQHEYARKVVAGTITDPTFFGYIAAADEADDWRKPATWKKANPGYNLTVKQSYLEAQARKAAQVPAYLNTFLRLHLNVWTGQATRFLPMHEFDACRGLVVEPDLAGRPCYAGLDLASSTDIAALVLLFPLDDDEQAPDGAEVLEAEVVAGEAEALEDTQHERVPIGADLERDDELEYDAGDERDDEADDDDLDDEPATTQRFAVVERLFVPAENIEQRAHRDGVPYDAWARDGHLIATPGNVIDYRRIRKEFRRLHRQFDIREVGYDRWGAVQLVQDLADDGLEVVPIGQGYSSMSPPTKELLHLVLSRRLVHDGNPVLRYMADSMAVEQDAAGNLKPSRKKSTGRIDGIVALTMALSRAVANESPASVYETRGLEVI